MVFQAGERLRMLEENNQSFALSRMLEKGMSLKDNSKAFTKKAGRSTYIHPIQ